MGNPIPLLDEKGILQVKLWQLLSLRLYMDEKQLEEFNGLLEDTPNVQEGEVRGLIDATIDPLVRRLKEQKRAFIRNVL